MTQKKRSSTIGSMKASAEGSVILVLSGEDRHVALFSQLHERFGWTIRAGSAGDLGVLLDTDLLPPPAYGCAASQDGRYPCLLALSASQAEQPVIRAIAERGFPVLVLGFRHHLKGPFVRTVSQTISAAALHRQILEQLSAAEAATEAASSAGQVREQFRTLLSSLPDIVYVLDVEGNFLYLNKAINSLGYEPEELIGRHFSVIIHPDDRPLISRDAVLERIRKGEGAPASAPKLFDERRSGDRMTRELEVRLLDRQGRVVHAMVNAYGERNPNLPVFEGPSPAQTVGVIHDVTAMYLYQQSLEESLHAKDALMREMYRRVRKNLQVIASLAHLRERASLSADVKDALMDIEAQIQSIAIVHEALYQSERVGNLGVRDFFSRFAHAAEESLGRIGASVHLAVQSDDAPLDPDRAMALSLLLLEMLSASCRCCRETRRAAEFRLQVSNEDGRLVFMLEGPCLCRSKSGEVEQSLAEQAGVVVDMQHEDGETMDRIILHTR